jgi:hypothetical protein
MGTGKANAGNNEVAVRIRAKDRGHNNAKQQPTLTSTSVLVGRIMVHSNQMIVT